MSVSSLLDAHLEDAIEYLNNKNYIEAKKTLDVAKIMLRRNDNAQIAFKYSKIYHRYEEESKNHVSVDINDSKDIPMQKALDRLMESKKQLDETEITAKDTLKDSKEELSLSGRILKRMSTWWR